MSTTTQGDFRRYPSDLTTTSTLNRLVLTGVLCLGVWAAIALTIFGS